MQKELNERKRRESELEEIGIKGGQGRSNYSVYESTKICIGCGLLAAILITLFAVSTIAG